MTREQILELLHAQVNVNGHIIGAAVGMGITARFAVMGGADFLLAVCAGRYRMMGRSSLGSYFCYGNNNEQVMEIGKREIFPILHDAPVLFGLLASDPGIHLYEYLKEIKQAGFAGIVNFPTIALIDGQFRQALEEEAVTYEQEVEAIRLASYMGLFTVGFATNIEEAKQMVLAGADVICVHLGLTKGGYLGARKQISIETAKQHVDKIFSACKEMHPDILRMIYAGPANTPADMTYLYQNTECQGYIGGSTFDRLPIERAVYDTTRAFKRYDEDVTNPLNRLVTGEWDVCDSVDFVKRYIEDHYMEEIQLKNLALVAHVSTTYLSLRFSREVGISFTQYLLNYRMNKAKELLQTARIPCKLVAEKVGYRDYAQFSKTFKKRVGMTPRAYRQRS